MQPIQNIFVPQALNPHPAGHNDNAANCPRTNHWLMISAEQDQFGCGYAGEEAVRLNFAQSFLHTCQSSSCLWPATKGERGRAANLQSARWTLLAEVLRTRFKN